MSLKLDGKKLSLEIEERLTDYISSNKKIAKRAPGLAVIRIGEDPASGVYVNNKEKACSRIGIKSFIFHLKESVEQKEVEELIIKLNSDKDIDGMLLQLPIPKKFARFENYSRDFKSTLDKEISAKSLLEAFMKFNAFRNQKLSIQVIDFLQKNNKLNPSLLSLNLEWNILLSELNSVSPSESSSQNGELVKKEIYNTRIDIIKNYLNE